MLTSPTADNARSTSVGASPPRCLFTTLVNERCFPASTYIADPHFTVLSSQSTAPARRSPEAAAQLPPCPPSLLGGRVRTPCAPRAFAPIREHPHREPSCSPSAHVLPRLRGRTGERFASALGFAPTRIQRAPPPTGRGLLNSCKSAQIPTGEGASNSIRVANTFFCLPSPCSPLQLSPKVRRAPLPIGEGQGRGL